jgi:hypothetical protein
MMNQHCEVRTAYLSRYPCKLKICLEICFELVFIWICYDSCRAIVTTSQWPNYGGPLRVLPGFVEPLYNFYK